MQQHPPHQPDNDELEIISRLAEYQATTEKNRLKSDGVVTVFIAGCLLMLAFVVGNISFMVYTDSINQEYTNELQP